jgi:hypothetical protein
VANPQTYNSSSCPRCRTEGQCLGAEAESTWYLCPTCRHAWQKRAMEARHVQHDAAYVAFPLVASA